MRGIKVGIISTLIVAGTAVTLTGLFFVRRS